MADLNGWGRGTWGEGPWGQADPVEITGVSSTGAVTTVTVSADANVSVTGVSSTGSIGSGKDLKSGGTTRGFFLITKNSSLDSYFFPVRASFTDWHE